MKRKSHTHIYHNHQTLQVYLYYRLALSGLLMVMFFSGIANNVLGVMSQSLYMQCSVAYCLSTVIALIATPARKLKHSRTRISAWLGIDIVALVTLAHASGGVTSGLGYLLIISAAMVSFFIRGQMVYAYAAAMSIAVMADTLFLFQHDNNLARALFSSGSLGILIFATTIALHYLTRKIRVTAEASEDQARHIRNLQEIAQNIVSRMQTGVIVVDEELKIDLMNNAALQMLDLPSNTHVSGVYLANLRELAPLLKALEQVLSSKESTVLRVRPGVDIRISVSHLETMDISKNILYLEDYSSIKQHAQQLKLASLGRLAASIAHEIRNPLGAISHASQLLAESDSLIGTEKRMTDIVLSNCGRVNDIIENTLALSRRKEPTPNQINLADWLPQFFDDAHIQHRESLVLSCLNNELLIKFDATHLKQILTNLVDNALRYSHEHAAGRDDMSALVIIEAGLMESDEKVYIDIKDNGKGISTDKLVDIFEPFYTTDEKGSGLGLYISKELAEINHANIHYRRNAENLSCFRIDFAHHQRIR